jgi:hypothetical protein
MSTPSDDTPLDRLATLAERLREKAAEIGLELDGFFAAPGRPGQPHVIQGVFFVADMGVEATTADEDDPLAGELAGILQATQQAEKEMLREARRQAEAEKADAARERLLALREKLDSEGGLFDE